MQIPAIKPTTPEAYQLINEGLIASAEATRHGIHVDVPYLIKQEESLKRKSVINKKRFLKSEIGRKWKDLYPQFNLNSNPQLREVLFSKKGLRLESTKQTKKGADSTDDEVLKEIQPKYPGVKHYLKYKKYLNTRKKVQLLLKEQVNGVLHPFFNLHTVRTFRSSSNSPNFQNFNKRDKELMKIIRSAFLPSPGNCLLEFDYGGIEVCISCCYHKDPKMIHYVEHPEKNNMHTDMAIQLFMLDQFKKEKAENQLRQGAKNGFVFPEFYGDYYLSNAMNLIKWGELPRKGSFDKNDGLKLMTGLHLGEHLGNKGVYDVDDFIDHVQDVERDFWENRFKVYNKWKDSYIAKYYKKGYLHMKTGFTCSGLMSKNDITNYPIQGSAFHCNLWTFIQINNILKKRGMKTRLIGQIHDSMIFDANPKEVRLLSRIMKQLVCERLPEHWDWVIVPMVLEMERREVDASWATETIEKRELRAA